jgi:UDP-N-acetylglucosamine diphosphorylase / glucose-1-phosphate thymidylyltransferase / UDP-N-acetylgalactosamine diphosphorylase / glucosamine-1-phosphate N-acetyltransferase / galactosamine-1-phosphate N-acetyltransferase
MRQFAGTGCGAWVRPELAPLYRSLHPELHINDLSWLKSADAILVNARWLPPAVPVTPPTQPCAGVVDGELAFVCVSAKELESLTNDNFAERLAHWLQTLPAQPVGGRLLRYPWDLVEQNGQQIVWDFASLSFTSRASQSSSRLGVVGLPSLLWIDPTAHIDPMVVVDTRQGPVVIDHHAVVTAFTRLEGPCYVGPRAQIFGAKIRAGTSVGAHCRVGGEVEASIMHDCSNKYHDGFLGHSYIGSWVNLAAGTQTSDLRNDYGEITVPGPTGSLRTGQNKVGCFIGDHTKTGLGTLINTGSHIGAFCSLLPSGRYAPRYVPSFTAWLNGNLGEAFKLDQLLTTAELVMKRRDVDMTDAHRDLYRAVHAQTAPERSRVCRDTGLPLRRSA